MISIRRMRLTTALCLALYIFVVLGFTVLWRPGVYRAAHFELFWSYRVWFAGDWMMGSQILGNIGMMIPFGLLLCFSIHMIRPKAGPWWIMVIICGAIFSLIIETLQLLTMRGTFEWDDLINNTLGSLIGWAVYRLLLGRPERLRLTIWLNIAAIVIAVSGLIYGLLRDNSYVDDLDNMTKVFGFQVEYAMLDNQELTLGGWAMRYDAVKIHPSIVLKDMKYGRDVCLKTDSGLMRRDVNAFFSDGEHDYTSSGFTATGSIEDSSEYEIMIRWCWSDPISTGAYITGDRIHYVPDDLADEPALQDILHHATLRVYRPDQHMWIYQDGDNLYWIADEDFAFEDDGTTYIQYQLYTTQTDRLPAKRLEGGHLWDNIGAYFEDYEINKDFGLYRVMKRKIPSEYAVTSILTGYYKSGSWIWKEYFRPLYDFSV